MMSHFGLSGCVNNSQTDNQRDSTAAIAGQQPFIAYLADTSILLQAGTDTVAVDMFTGLRGQILDPAVTQDGKLLAYTYFSEESDERTIRLMETSSDQDHQLNVPSQNFYGPIWNHQGTRLAFSVFERDELWKIGLIDRDNQGYTLLDSASQIDFYSPTWRAEDQVVAHDLVHLYTLDMDGQIVEKLLLDSLVGSDFNRSSDDQYYFSQDNSSIIFQSGNPKELASFQGPMQSVFRLNLEDEKIEQLTPDSMHVRRLIVAGDDQIYYEASADPDATTFLLFEWSPVDEAKPISAVGGAVTNVISVKPKPY